MSWAGIADFGLLILIIVLLVYGNKLRHKRAIRLRREAFDRHYREYEESITEFQHKAEERARRGTSGEEDSDFRKLD